jgi:GxxExxY protein
LIEVKAIDLIADIHKAITLTYLTFTHHKLGLLINFNVRILKDCIKRVVNGL